MSVKPSSSKCYYLYYPDANSFAGVGFSSDESDKVIETYWIDEPQSVTWRPRTCCAFDEPPVVEGDFPVIFNFMSLPLMSERAWVALRPLIGYCCEALPIIHPSGKPYYIVHVMNTIDCLDIQASEVSRSEVRKNRINGIYRYAFKDGMLSGEHIFKLPHMSGGELIVDDEFRRVVEDNGLRGLLFHPLPMSQRN